MVPKIPSSFRTLEREHQFRHPSRNGSDVPILEELVAPHIESFNALFEDAGGRGLLDLATENIEPRVVFDGKGRTGETSGQAGWGNKMEIKIQSVFVARPMASERQHLPTTDTRLYPAEARERLTTYRGKMVIKLAFRINDGAEEIEAKECGLLPIMVRSNRCNLKNLSAADLVAHKEEAEEFGGYFIVNGNERLIRYLILPRRNHVISLIRNSFTNRGPSYTPYAVNIRCVRPDQSGVTNSLHYLSNGSAMLRFSWRKQEYLIPSCSASDKEIFEGVMMGDYENTFLSDRVELLLRSFKTFRLHTGEQCLDYLGDKFRVVAGMPEDWNNLRMGSWLLTKVILVHLDYPRDKYRLLLFMLRKLLSLVSGECCADNPDSPQHQEILLPGSLYGMIIKERMEEIVTQIRQQIALDVRRENPAVDFLDSHAKNQFRYWAKMSNFLATGNLVSPTGLDLQQASGFTIIAEKLNWYRYISHFRCVHRGAFFTELKTTTVRKLLPEAWGFICPVHTPDGSPCGLLNHLSRTCRIITEPLAVSHIPKLLFSLGMTRAAAPTIDGRKNLCIQLDGCVIGWASPKSCKQLATTLRIYKTEGTNNVPLDLEIGFVPVSRGGQYPGLYLFSTLYSECRDDSIGSFEQEIEPGVSTHVEHSPTAFLSILANLTPFSDFNQMGKQTMGTPSTALQHRTDNKLYRLQTGQTPIVRPELHNTYGMDCFPNGTNAVVAVISYTGYDMEDAMILNKSSHERGFGYGTIYKSHIVSLKDVRGTSKSSKATLHFGIGPDIPDDHTARESIDPDGYPLIGTRLSAKAPIAAYMDDTTGRTRFVRYKGEEQAYIDNVRILGNDVGDSEAQKIHITLRITRSPVIGDKFSSRHGQKGVCSQKWPSVDMPFSESGIQPDVIINPHAFPSRMTIGMFVESMAGKAGAMHGLAQDATPFNLVAAGYNYYGNEPMYSGITGQEFAADIYLGVVYYQRLRHMVDDKFQVRTTGPVDPVTRQPVKLIAHGTSYLLQDRLMNCSDYSTAWVCRTCGSLITLGFDDVSLGEQILGRTPTGEYCRVCRADAEEEDARARRSLGDAENDVTPRSRLRIALPPQNVFGKATKGGDMDVVAIPYVFRYLCAELASMGISIALEVST
ncbi:hypothetical protein BS47DRAFT_1370286 [Hydnum rufescens UP504]|uniref:DNA-directed RNA polymerase n=1 Tax=Hydnum rufescens UP504 TaxID=1448309 RepID=A0A9P6BAD1_9AGAM|nr:hypothetical protein BS47DRAFT_1370286 [Hydnum rufescens UP504]